jgi:hypothetical protein
MILNSILIGIMCGLKILVDLFLNKLQIKKKKSIYRRSGIIQSYPQFLVKMSY